MAQATTSTSSAANENTTTDAASNQVYARSAIHNSAPFSDFIRSKQDRFADLTYKMDHVNRGHCLIFNHEYFHWSVRMNRRVGTNIDAENMKSHFENLGFSVSLYKDLTTVRVREIIYEVACKTDHTNYDCFVCVLLSHGDDGLFYTHDGIIHIPEIIDSFRADSCPSLAGKPKLFFIQACRGDRHEIGVDPPDEVDSPDEEVEPMTVVDNGTKPTVPGGADFLLAYSVTQGYYSHRDTAYGSWFIQALSYVIDTYGDQMEVTDMLTVVNKMVSDRSVERAAKPEMIGKKQIPCFLSMLTKKLFFTPRQR